MLFYLLTTTRYKVLYQSSIYENIVTTVDDFYLKDGLRAIIEDHLDWLRERGETILVDPYDAYRFNYDLSGYLQTISIPTHYHWIVMRMNNMKYNWEFKDTVEMLSIPKDADIEYLSSVYASNLYSIN